MEDETLVSLDWILSNFYTGDEYDWDVEFDYLTTEPLHKKRVQYLVEQIPIQGIWDPIILGNDGRVWDGHHRLCAAKILGLSHVPVLLPTKLPKKGE